MYREEGSAVGSDLQVRTGLTVQNSARIDDVPSKLLLEWSR
jgi:hypothetical protein